MEQLEFLIQKYKCFQANMFNFKTSKMFETAPEERNNVKVDFSNEQKCNKNNDYFYFVYVYF